MSKSVRVKVEFEMQVVIGDGFNAELACASEDDQLNALGKHWMAHPEATRHLVIAETVSVAAIKECIKEHNAAVSDDTLAFRKLGNVRAQVISEKK